MSRRQIAEQKARGAFAFDVDERPAKETIDEWHRIADADAQAKHREMSRRLVAPQMWHESFGGADDGPGSMYEGFVRGTDEAWPDIRPAFELFRDSAQFAPYRRSKELAEKVIDILVGIMRQQFISLRSTGNWFRLLGLCQLAHFVLPFPDQPTAKRLAEDGQPIAVNDRSGQPVIYDGRAYSDKMLDALSSSEYEKVLGLRETAREQFEREQSAANRSQEKAAAYHNEVVARYKGQSYTQYQLDHEVTADTYRLIMGIRKGDSGADQARLLAAMNYSLQ
jgi:hypothetical protein